MYFHASGGTKGAFTTCRLACCALRCSRKRYLSQYLHTQQTHRYTLVWEELTSADPPHDRPPTSPRRRLRRRGPGPTAVAASYRAVEVPRPKEIVVMPLACVKHHTALVIKLRVRPGEVPPQVEGFEPGGVAACRKFRYHLSGV